MRARSLSGRVSTTEITDKSNLDASSYHFSLIKFSENLDGTYAAREVPLPDSFEGQAPNAKQVKFDIFGDGLSDHFDTEGCRNDLSLTSGGPFCQSPAPSPANLAAVRERPRVLVGNGAGARAGRSALTPELMSKVSDAFGPAIEWTYDALSSKAGRSGDSVPLYRVPARDGSNSAYVDAKHFYFTSSMQVVAEMFTRNGVDGMNETRYGYEEAMYNTQGRGFQGFRKVISEDRTVDGSFVGLRNTAIFHQKFP